MFRSKTHAIGFALLFILAPSPCVQARALFVDATAPSGGNGSSWDQAYNDLQDALTNARIDLSVREIWIADGIYLPSSSMDREESFDLVENVSLYGGFEGSETSRDQRDPSVYRSILSGDLAGDDLPNFQNYDENSLHVVRTMGVSSRVLLDGLVIRSGGALEPRDGGAGAGVSMIGGAAQFRHCRFEANYAIVGGGLWVEASASPTFEDCTFEGNRATAGGGLQVFEADATFLRCQFLQNQATSGGAIITGSGTYELVDCHFEGNAATKGAGYNAAANSTAVVTRCQFVRNTGTTGTAMATGDGADVTVIDSEFFENDANSGAGMSLSPGSDALVIDCKFRDNTASTGTISISSDSTLTMDRCEIHDNDVDSRGGALYVLGGNATLTRTSLRRNTAGFQGGGIYTEFGSPHEPTVVLDNCFVVDNDNGQLGNAAGGDFEIRHSTLHTPNVGDPSVRVFAGTVSISHCIVWGLTGTPIVSSGATVEVEYSDVNGGWVGPGNIDLDPQFVDESQGDLRLQQTSPCVDAGNILYLPPGTDFYGDPRFLDGQSAGSPLSDMGADEYAETHLDITGTFAPSGNLRVETTGRAGMVQLMLVGLSSEEFVLPGFGTMFVNFADVFFTFPWGTSPNVVDVPIPPEAPTGTSFYFQVLAQTGGAGTLSNPREVFVE